MAAIDDWMAAYLEAWGSSEPERIRALFTEDAEYYSAPHVAPYRGHDEIVEWWRGVGDDATNHTFSWRTIANDGAVAVVRGRTDYTRGDAFENLWVIEFAVDGRARAFTEWYMHVDEKDL